MQRDNLPAGHIQGTEPVALARPRHTSESGDRIMAAGSAQPELHEASFPLTSLGFLILTQGMLTWTGSISDSTGWFWN